MTTIPKYVQNILSRSRFDFTTRDTDTTAVGYTIRVRKATPYTNLPTFRAELERLINWVDRTAGVTGTAFINDLPDRNRHCTQYATVTIFDPVMQQIEHLIPRD